MHLYYQLEERGDDVSMADVDHLCDYLYGRMFSEHYVWVIGSLEGELAAMAQALERWMHRSVK